MEETCGGSGGEGHCFFCLSGVPPQLLTSVVKVDPDGVSESFQSVSESEFYPEYSLQYLIHYLRLGWVSGETSQQSVQANEGKSGLKVVLCEGCGDLNGRFTKLYQQLEKIQMELQHCLRSVHRKLTQGKARRETDVITNCLGGRGKEDVTLGILRKGMMQNCLWKLKQASPRVEIERVDGENSPSLNEGDETSNASHQLDIEMKEKETRATRRRTIPHVDAENTDPLNLSENESSDGRLEEDYMPEVDEAPEDSNDSEDTTPTPLPRKAPKRCFQKFQRNPNTGKFKCPDCDKEFGLLSSTRVHHRNIHLEPGIVVQCDLCGKGFSSQNSLKTHHRVVHLQVKPYQCDECDLQFSKPSYLTEHKEEVHLKMKPHFCEECGKSFGRKSNLELHQRAVHLKIKPHRCDKCEKQFGTKKELCQHRDAVHLKIRSCVCDVCGKAFSFQKDLKLHNRIVHLQLKPHQCSQCDKKFARANELKRHSDSVHPNNNNHECKQCGQHFNQLGDLQLHQKEKHRDHLCDLCGNGFHLVKSLKRHRKNIHSKVEGKGDDKGESCQEQSGEIRTDQKDLPNVSSSVDADMN